MLKGKVILTRDVSLSCIDFQLWVEETLQTDISTYYCLLFTQQIYLTRFMR